MFNIKLCNFILFIIVTNLSHNFIYAQNYLFKFSSANVLVDGNYDPSFFSLPYPYGNEEGFFEISDGQIIDFEITILGESFSKTEKTIYSDGDYYIKEHSELYYDSFTINSHGLYFNEGFSLRTIRTTNLTINGPIENSFGSFQLIDDNGIGSYIFGIHVGSQNPISANIVLDWGNRTPLTAYKFISQPQDNQTFLYDWEGTFGTTPYNTWLAYPKVNNGQYYSDWPDNSYHLLFPGNISPESLEGIVKIFYPNGKDSSEYEYSYFHDASTRFFVDNEESSQNNYNWDQSQSMLQDLNFNETYNFNYTNSYNYKDSYSGYYELESNNGNSNGSFISYDGKWDLDYNQIPDGIQLSQGDIIYINEEIALDSDTDNDGISNEIEAELGTNIFSIDSDNDGIGDYDEIYNYLTSPNLIDTDEDKISDYEEIFTYGTNPIIKDTDNDGLSDYFEIYRVLTNPLIFSGSILNEIHQEGFIKSNDFRDLRPGSTMIEVSGNQATVQLQMEESSDLQTWEDTGTPATMTIPADTDTKFFRFKMAE